MHLRWTAVVAGAAALALGASACGGVRGASTDGTASTAAAAHVPAFAKNFQAPATGCGSFAAPAPADPDGVIAALPAAQRDALAGYTNFEGSTIKITASTWKDWKPTHAGPFTVAISWGQLVSDFQVQTYADLQSDLKQSPSVKQVLAKSTGSNLDIAQQLSQYNALVQQKPDLIILESPSPDSFAGPINKAAAQGIPTVTLLTPVGTKNAVNVDGNNYLGAGTTASYMSRVLRGKGSILIVHGIAGVAVDSQEVAAWKAVIKSCPGMKVAGEVYGQFSDAGAKSETLKFLATHPAKVAGAVEVASMAPGVMKAFQQSGRPMPVVPDIGLSKGSIGYWRQNQATYHNAATTLPPLPGAAATVEVALRMLAGQGVTINTVVGKTPLVTDANLDDWSQPGWTLDTPGAVPGTRDSFLPSSYLDGFFRAPAAVK
jgi:ribose transport system substrate-binding protein